MKNQLKVKKFFSCELFEHVMKQHCTKQSYPVGDAH